jgi:hypothetical protein
MIMVKAEVNRTEPKRGGEEWGAEGGMERNGKPHEQRGFNQKGKKKG